MLTIFKYQITPNDVVEIDMPFEANILTVQTQHGDPQLWALVDDSAKIETRRFIVVGTGHAIKHSITDIEYIGTFQVYDGSLVFHLFELTA